MFSFIFKQSPFHCFMHVRVPVYYMANTEDLTERSFRQPGEHLKGTNNGRALRIRKDR